MSDILRRLIPACCFVGAVLLVTLAVLALSPYFVAIPVAVCCAIATRALLAPDPGAFERPGCAVLDEVTFVPRPGDGAR